MDAQCASRTKSELCKCTSTPEIQRHCSRKCHSQQWGLVFPNKSRNRNIHPNSRKYHPFSTHKITIAITATPQFSKNIQTSNMPTPTQDHDYLSKRDHLSPSEPTKSPSGLVTGLIIAAIATLVIIFATVLFVLKKSRANCAIKQNDDVEANREGV